MCMKLLNFLFKTEGHRKLANLLWVENLSSSVHEFSEMTDLPYATAYDLLNKLEGMALVRKTRKGRATLFSSNLSDEELKPLRTLLNPEDRSEKQKSWKAADFDLPLAGEFKDLSELEAGTKEEFLVKATALAKKDATLLRTLPLLAVRLGHNLRAPYLSHWSRRLHLDRELGFTLDLTATLSHDKKFAHLARKFRDKRWAKPSFFLSKDQDVEGFQAELVERNTPDLARKWFLRLNMNLDSFKSLYSKFA